MCSNYGCVICQWLSRQQAMIQALSPQDGEILKNVHTVNTTPFPADVITATSCPLLSDPHTTVSSCAIPSGSTYRHLVTLWMTTRYTTPLPLYVCACICVCVWGLPCSPFSYMYTCTVGVKQCLHVYRFVCWQKILKNASGKLARVCRGFIVDANNERTLLGMFMYTWYKSRQFFAIIFSCFLLSVHRLHPFWNCTW